MRRSIKILRYAFDVVRHTHWAFIRCLCRTLSAPFCNISSCIAFMRQQNIFIHRKVNERVRVREMWSKSSAVMIFLEFWVRKLCNRRPSDFHNYTSHSLIDRLNSSLRVWRNFYCCRPSAVLLSNHHRLMWCEKETFYSSFFSVGLLSFFVCIKRI